jgi:hypothetical protein
MVQGLGVWGLACTLSFCGSGFKKQGFGFRVWGLVFRVQSFGRFWRERDLACAGAPRRLCWLGFRSSSFLAVVEKVVWACQTSVPHSGFVFVVSGFGVVFLWI